MAKTLVDVEKKVEVLDGTYQETTKKGWGWKLWLLIPLPVAAVAGCAYFIVRRFVGAEK